MNGTMQAREDCCTECGAARMNNASRCWLCGAELTPAQLARGRWTFSLRSLMLLMTLIAVCLGVGVIAPGLGVLLAVISAPAVIRTAVLSARQRSAGTPQSFEEKAVSFVSSLWMVALVALAAGIAFFAACWIGVGAGMLGSSYDSLGVGFMVGLGLGGVAALVVFVWLMRRIMR